MPFRAVLAILRWFPCCNRRAAARTRTRGDRIATSLHNLQAEVLALRAQNHQLQRRLVGAAREPDRQRAFANWVRIVKLNFRLARLRRIWAFLGHHLREIRARGRIQ